MNSADLASLETRGDLAYRSILTYGRLEGKWYKPWEVFSADINGWPGDWEGRIILALTLMAQATHRPPAFLDDILAACPAHFNDKGYFGQICRPGLVHEQQLSGHSWFLRGLVEYYRWKKDESVRAMIETVARNLLLPAQDNYACYPIDPADRQAARENPTAWELSHFQSKSKTHAETVDTGCGFIMLDGATAAYELLGWPELKELIGVMIDRFRQIDLAATHVQTHATLTATRGILRFYELTGERGYLELGRSIYDLYRTTAWTEHYCNYNWFGQPRWTEPCAIIDSYIVSTWLWRLTAESRYLEDAHHIYYNGIAHAHRASGCFGTDYCLGARDPFLRPKTYEVYWCCTMRGGELFEKAHEFCYFTDGDVLTFAQYHDWTGTVGFASGEVRLRMDTGYPYDGTVRLSVSASASRAKHRLRFFAPPWTRPQACVVKLNGAKTASALRDGFIECETALAAGDRLELDMGVFFRAVDTVNASSLAGCHSFRHGPMILATDTGEELYVGRDAVFEPEPSGRARYRFKETQIVFAPINDTENLTLADHNRQALFRADDGRFALKY